MNVLSSPSPAAPPWWEQPMGTPTVTAPVPCAQPSATAVPPAPPPAPQPTATPPPAAAPPPTATPPPAAAPPLDVRSLLHPAEHSRLMIALSSSAIVFGVAAMAVYAHDGWQTLAELAGVLAVFGTLIWLFLQVVRSRLLGGAVRVSETTLPELQSVVDDVRTRLDYRKHVEVYVMDQVDGGSVMTSYLGTRLIQLDGGLVAELLDNEHHAELTYLIARHIGQLKARHQRLPLIVLVISMVDSLKFLQLFLAPYFRATAKSGDQIGAACCGDIQATAVMMNRLLVGKELGPRLVIKGVLDQAATVRRRRLPRLAQLFMSVPHATNRYLNLLAFFARIAPQEIDAWRATMDQATASRLTAVLAANAGRRPPRRRPNPWSTLLALALSGGTLAATGWLIFVAPGALGALSALGIPGAPGAPGAASAASMSTQDRTALVAGAGNTPASGNSGSPSGQAPTAAALAAASHQLLARMPSGFASTCQAITVSAAASSLGADAEVVCQPAALGSGGYVTYAHYRTHDAMQSVYAGLAHGVPSGNCTSADAQGNYAQGSSPNAGVYACVAVTGQNDFAWTDNQLDILTVAASDRMTLGELYHWWLHTDTGPESTPSAAG